MKLELSPIQEQLFDFVKIKHGSQVRKYTGEPYTNHCLSVAEIVSEYGDYCVEVALCHDLFEDTTCNFSELYKRMITIGYGTRFSYSVCTYVTELTDKYIKEDYPYLNRKRRKELEAERLGGISFKAQTVKYADLIDNTGSIVEHDAGFAKVYLAEKRRILELMNKGDKSLYKICLETINIKKL